MRFRSEAEPGHYTIVVGDRTVGYIRPGVVGFRGFASESDALVGARVAEQALAERRAAGSRRSADTTVVAGGAHRAAQIVSPNGAAANWGIEVTLDTSERAPVFTMSRARTIWRALQDPWRSSV